MPLMTLFRDISTAQKWALAGSLVAVALATLVPAMVFGDVQYDVMVALTLVSTIAIIVAGAFAADNLTAFRTATEAEFTPYLDITLGEIYKQGHPILSLQIHNIGRGFAAGVEALLWWTDSDQVTWIPHRVPDIADLLGPGQTVGGTVKHPQFHFPIQRHLSPQLPALVLELRYRDALGRVVDSFTPYELGDSTDDVRGLLTSHLPIPTQLRSLEGKQKLVNTMAEGLTQELGLKEHGFVLSSKVRKDLVQLRLMADDEQLWMGQVGIETGVYQLGEWLTRAMPEILERRKAGESPSGSGEEGEYDA